tara:strand:- start:268 stop:426 length:159 start_codon:yes stop_codon:yes gene_type:complete
MALSGVPIHAGRDDMQLAELECKKKILLIAMVQDHLRACGDNHDEDCVLFLS